MDQGTGSDEYGVAPAPHIPELYSWELAPPPTLPAQEPITLPVPPPAVTQLPVAPPPAATQPPAPQPPTPQPPAAQPPAGQNPAPAFAWLGELAQQDEHTPSGHGILDLHVEPPVADASGRSALGVVALVAAILVAPLGIVLGAVAGVLGRRRVGYFPGVAKAAVVVGIVLSLVGVAGGVAYGLYAQHTAQQAAIRASSQPMCAALATKPGLLASSSLQWPGLSSTIAQYVSDTTAYAKYWKSTAAIAPAGISGQVKKIAAAAQGNVDRLAASKVADTGQDVADMTAVASASSLPAWVASYCG